MLWTMLSKENGLFLYKKNEIFQGRWYGVEKTLTSKDDAWDKFKQNYQGPYLVTKVSLGGALTLSQMDEISFMSHLILIL